MSKFRVLDAPRLRPGHCFVCRGTQHPPFIDTGLQIQFEGAVIICSACITEMFTQLDLTVVINEVEVAAKVAAAKEDGRLIGEQIALEALNEFVAQYQSPGLNALLASVGDSPVLEDVEEQPADVAKPERKSRKESGASDAGNLEESGIDSEPGRSDVSGDSGDGSKPVSNLTGFDF